MSLHIILVFPDWSPPFMLQAGASEVGAGAA